MALGGIEGVSGDADTRTDAERIRVLHEAKAAEEIAAADAAAPGSDGIPWRGSLLPAVAVVKGLPGPAEASGGAAVSGADGVAVVKALEALGHDGSQVFFTLSRPAGEIESGALTARLRGHIEAVDAALVVALDAEAAEDVAAAFGLSGLGLGVEVRVAGRRLVAVEGMEAALGDATLKRRVWEQISAARPPGPVL